MGRNRQQTGCTQHTGYVQNTGQMYILTKTLSRDYVTFTLTRTTESKLRSKLVHQVITSAQSQHFNEGGNYCHNSKIWVHCTTPVDNDVLGKRVFQVSHDQESSHYLLPLSLHFCKTHGIPLIIQHFPAWRLQPQTLVAGKMFAALEVSQIFVLTMSQHKDVLATNMAKEMAAFCRNTCGPSHKKMPNIKGPKFSSCCTSFCTVTVDGAHPCHSHRRLCRSCRPTEEQHGMASAIPTPTGSKHHLILWTASVCQRFEEWKEISCVCAKKFAELQTIRGKENNIWRWERVILARHNGSKNLSPLLSIDRKTKSDQLVTCRVHERNRRVGGKVVWKENNAIDELPRSATRKKTPFSFSIDT